MSRALVIGGGAAGVCAAIAAAEGGARVTLLDRNSRLMKKLCATGNGRGNLMNLGAPAYPGGADFARAVLQALPIAELRAFFERIGVTLTADAEGRVYPAAYMASVVADAIAARLNGLNVSIIPDARADTVEPQAAGGFITRGIRTLRSEATIKKSGKRKAGDVVDEQPFELISDTVIIAVGGRAAPAFGTDGSGYAFLSALGHELTPTRPALCALTTDKRSIAGLSGQRVRARLTLTRDETPCSNAEKLHASEGEALFADDGVSGIAAMQLARYVRDGCTLHIDMRAAIIGDGDANALMWVQRRAETLGALQAKQFFTGAASPALSRALLRYAGLADAQCLISALTPAALAALAGAIADFRVPVTGTRGFEQAQVTAGGIATRDFDPQTLQSRLVGGVYAAGEALDVDGDCGGFNLMFAFASGILAGRAAARHTSDAE